MEPPDDEVSRKHEARGVRGVNGFWATPEDAVLQSWPPAAEVRIISVEEIADDRVKFRLKVGPNFDQIEYADRSEFGWKVGDGEGM